MLKTIAISLFLILTTFCDLKAQSFQLAGVSYASHLKSELADSTAQGQKLEFQDLSVFVKLPKQFKNKKTTLVNTLRYTQTQITQHNSPLFLEPQKRKNLHTITLSALMLQKMGKKWTTILALTPTIASDFKEPYHSEDLLLQGAALATFQLSEVWAIGGGAIYTTQLGEARFLPAVQLKYSKKKHNFSMLLPSFARYLYQLDQSNRWRIGCRLATNGGNFNVSAADFSEVMPININRLYIARINTNAVLQFQASKYILLEANGGISAARNIRLQNLSGDQQKYKGALGGYVHFGLILTAPAKNTDSNNLDN